MNRRVALSAVAAAPLVGHLAHARAGAQGTRSYVIRELVVLGGRRSAAAALNASSEVVGVSETADGAFHAALWSRGRITDLGTLPGYAASAARAINAAGQVVGSATGPAEASRAFLWDR